jgi:hypothetical protein
MLALETSTPDEVLSAVFALNNKVGPRLRSTHSPGLRNLQHKINEVTVAVKAGDRERLRNAIVELEASAAALEPTGG